ncbi:MAG: D-tyrosyl-tRNA(Tyr) deacylase [Ignavibacteriales bacterium]|nr:MAG: D-tyrosyl-tRNA(Tyr) deacylase [Ignavibacteriales bacterium]
MRALLQRVSRGGVDIPEDDYSASIGKGLVVLLGVKHSDTEADALYLADKTAALRIFSDDEGKMNLSVTDIAGEILVISQFTLYGDGSKGNRPGFTDSAKPPVAIPLYEKYIRRLRDILGDEKIKTGIFGAMMSVEIINDGPVTIMLESKNP